MCEPTTMAAIAFPVAASAAVVAGGAQAYSAYQQGQAEADQAAFQRDVEKRAAIDAVERGAAESGQARTAGSAAAAQNKVSLAASGLDVQSGTALDILSGTRGISELDVQTIKNNAAREAWGHQVQAAQYEFARKNAKYNAKLGVVSSFLGAAAQGASIYAMGATGGSAKGGA